MMQNFLLVAINKIVKTAKASMSKKYKLLEKYVALEEKINDSRDIGKV